MKILFHFCIPSMNELKCNRYKNWNRFSNLTPKLLYFGAKLYYTTSFLIIKLELSTKLGPSWSTLLKVQKTNKSGTKNYFFRNGTGAKLKKYNKKRQIFEQKPFHISIKKHIQAIVLRIFLRPFWCKNENSFSFLI